MNKFDVWKTRKKRWTGVFSFLEEQILTQSWTFFRDFLSWHFWLQCKIGNRELFGLDNKRFTHLYWTSTLLLDFFFSPNLSSIINKGKSIRQIYVGGVLRAFRLIYFIGLLFRNKTISALLWLVLVYCGLFWFIVVVDKSLQKKSKNTLTGLSSAPWLSHRSYTLKFKKKLKDNIFRVSELKQHNS